MSNYSPYERGAHPVGVKSFDLSHSDRERTIPVDVWYPADAKHKGQDLDKDTQDKYAITQGFPELPQEAVRDADSVVGDLPLIVFSHGFAGHRRQTTHFCCHLASHGYAVVSPDHLGNTLPDIMGLASEMSAKNGKQGLGNLGSTFDDFKDNRPADASLCIDKALAGDYGLSINADQIGISGHSFGGWTTLQTTINDKRIRAALPLAPAGGASGSSIADNMLNLDSIDFPREVPTLYLVADKDTLLPLDGMHDLYEKTAEPKKMLILENSDHFHFCDNVEMIHDMMINMGSGLFGRDNDTGPLSTMQKSSELASGESAYTFLRGMGLAHMDAHVKGLDAAADLLAGDLQKELAGKNVVVEVYSA